MSIVYLLLPASLLLALVALAAYLWATKTGQFDDLDTPSLRILGEDSIPSSSDRPLPDSKDSKPPRI